MLIQAEESDAGGEGNGQGGEELWQKNDFCVAVTATAERVEPT